MTQQKTNQAKTRRKKIIVVVFVLAAILIIDLTITGYLKFGYYVAKCGGMPVALTPGGFMAGPVTYELPGNYTPGWSGRQYLCTDQEAIDSHIPMGLETRYRNFIDSE